MWSIILATLLAGLAYGDWAPWGLNYKSVNEGDAYIINGNDAAKGRWPWLLSLEVLDPEFRHTCGASLLDEQHAMTAAHCLDGRFPNKTFRVVVGCSNRGIDGVGSDREDSVNVVGAILHENYTRCPACPDGWPNDIALMYLERPVTFNEFVQPAVLAEPELTPVYENASCFVSGWGLLHGTDDTVPTVLQEAEISVQSNEDCAELMPTPNNPRINEGHVCIYDERAVMPEEKRNVCSGDSGSPLMCAYEEGWHVLGSASWVIVGPEIDSACNPNMPGVYNRVTHYLDWVEEKLADDSWKNPEYYSQI